ncbi:MAG: peptidylprolyl isomerase [Nitrospiraceae bacterium]|nr:peptidylprolyl isomerase [Nitrospiraceae bacterium]
MKYIRAALWIIFLAVVPGIADAAVLLDRVVAIVNQEVITWSELYHNMEQDAVPQVRDMKPDERAKIFKSNEASYLETLINAKLQIQEAHAVGMGVSPEEIKEAMDNIKKKYGMSEEQFRESLKKEGFDYDEYRKKLGDQILIGKIVNQQVKSKVVVSDADLDRFIAENKDYGIGSEGYRISQIFFRKPKKNDDKKAVEEKAREVMAKLKAGEKFEDLAKAYSEEPMAADGGNLGLLRKDQLMKEFIDALAVLKPGEVSSPFWTERGLHIIRLDERIAAKDPAEIRDDARKELTSRVFMEYYNKWIKKLREKAFIEIRL